MGGSAETQAADGAAALQMLGGIVVALFGVAYALTAATSAYAAQPRRHRVLDFLLLGEPKTPEEKKAEKSPSAPAAKRAMSAVEKAASLLVSVVGLQVSYLL